MKRYRLAQILFIVLLISGCARPVERDDVLHLRLKEDPTTLDPAYIVDVSGGVIAAKLYNGLVRIDEHCRVVPDIAQSWEISADGCVYTFKLRADAKFSDGRPVTAEDFRRCYQRIIDPATTSPRRWLFDKVREFRVVAPDEFQVKLTEPFAPFLNLLAMPNAYLVSADNLGTGPYVLAEWQHDNRLLLKPNEFYFGQAPKVAGIEYRVIPEEFTTEAEFELGQLDMIEISLDDWPRYQANDKWQTCSQSGLNTYYIGFNCQQGPFNSYRLRQAFNYAVDKQKIITHLLEGQARAAKGPVPPALLTDDLPGYSYLPNKAKRLLQQSGVTFSEPIKIYVRAQKESIHIVESIQHYLAELGIPVQVVPLEWSAFKEAVAKGQADMFLMSWWADYPSAENFLYPTFHSANWGSGGNRARFKDPLVDRLITQAQAEADPEKRAALYRQAQRLIARQAPWLFLWHKNELVVAQPWISGLKLYPVYNGDKGTDVSKTIDDRRGTRNE